MILYCIYNFEKKQNNIIFISEMFFVRKICNV